MSKLHAEICGNIFEISVVRVYVMGVIKVDDMEKFDFHPQEREFVAGANRVYIGYLPPHLADKELPADVARVVMFHLKQRVDNTLTFMGGAGYATPFYGKALKSQNREAEISYITYEGTRIILEATRYIMGGRRIRKSANK